MTFYERLRNQPDRLDNQELQSCINEAVELLLDNDLNEEPIMLLGKIQSGKTRGFIGILALAFDRGFDVAIILTKNSKLLTDQTVKRLEKDLRQFIVSREFEVHDIFQFRDRTLRPSELLNKKIFVAKKQVDNIKFLIDCFVENNPELSNKRVLIIDDEADYGSVGYITQKDTGYKEMLKTADKISEFRSYLEHYSFLQVTATPYSLYLQPGTIETASGECKPLRPADTVLLPIHDKYVGGEFYFEEYIDPSSPASNLHITTSSREISTLSSKKQDRRIVTNVVTTPQLHTFRLAIRNFITGVAIRRCQDSQPESKNKKETPIHLQLRFAFIFHIDTGKSKMAWQQILVDTYLDKLSEMIEQDEIGARTLFKISYDDLADSISKGDERYGNIYLPTFTDVWNKIKEIFRWKDYNSYLINSDEPIITMTTEDGQLELRTGLNFFIGGQVLDRGITIDNLIGFYYGRNPYTSQMDTVLQHSRMYGNRSKQDLCVTRFYTNQTIFNKMKEIHDVDSALRTSIDKAKRNPDQPYSADIFIMEAAQGGIRPTSRARIALSSILTMKGHKRILPYGFETRSGRALSTPFNNITEILSNCKGFTTEANKTFNLPLDQIKPIFDNIDKCFLKYEDGYEDTWESEFMIELIKTLCADAQKNYIKCYVQLNRKISRKRSNGEYSNAPDTSTTDGVVAKNAATDIPCLVILEQQGRKTDGWSDGKFYWPVFYAPNLSKPILIARKK